jgi:hypothetical protein
MWCFCRCFPTTGPIIDWPCIAEAWRKSKKLVNSKIGRILKWHWNIFYHSTMYIIFVCVYSRLVLQGFLSSGELIDPKCVSLSPLWRGSKGLVSARPLIPPGPNDLPRKWTIVQLLKILSPWWSLSVCESIRSHPGAKRPKVLTSWRPVG